MQTLELHVKVCWDDALCPKYPGFLPTASTTFIPQCESGAIHLVGGSDTYEGRVEYCIMGTWTSICAYPSSWNTSNSLVVCNELGFNTSSMYF